MRKIDFENILYNFKNNLKSKSNLILEGKVNRIVGVTIESTGPDAAIGDLCKIKLKNKNTSLAETVGFKDNNLLLMPYEDVEGLYVGASVKKLNKKVSINVGDELLGRVVDGLCRPIDEKDLKLKDSISIYNSPPNPLKRKNIENPLSVGIKAIDGMLTIGRGQRISIMAGSGVGKSTLLGMIARNTEADINIIALIGERGREVREFLERDLGEKGLKKSVVIVSTSDQPALMRVKALYTATSIAEYFRDKGKNVLLMVDSLTRWAMAKREIGLSTGEPPATRGYTPSVFSDLPKILERAGNSDKGTMTGVYTVLVEADDMNDPIGDTVRGIVDGHIVLSRKLADSGHYPAIDILSSVSRVMNNVISKEHLISSRLIKDLYSTYKDAKDLIEVGAYKKGMNQKIDKSIELINDINLFLTQDVSESFLIEDIVQKMLEISNMANN
ncbi:MULTISPECIES: flagellar protein export ATPase FliI [Oceanotoga]|jgi:flagellum-specific ATP synthase|uniref:Type III secretion system FliI/YscN family ATPase n=1 Tax=Oceanotoga teriensis TaxID=515440 RepID=A0AA45HHZ8_9BACT|nr:MULTISPECIES: flagellar protein export ATPase FliI [Oceanotoga]MDN5342305.1 flagellum-specific synthase [Oceanotoga sp.]MDO7977368.1 flagellar protein export ATPase FliI [Oceanotoga teriensis]PWJ88758.1 type III secretion system FliI/YscN family ATPase [Oceanotoga teriensis]